jgi:hypothetical protein
MSASATEDLWVARLLADPVLALSSYRELARLVPYLEQRTLAPGDTLYRTGDAVQAMYLVLQGELLLTPPGGTAQPANAGRAGEEVAGDYASHLTDA